MKLTPVHLFRIGEGSAAVRLEARGPGWVVGNVGLRLLRGAVDEVRLVRGRRAWALFIGLRGIRWASLRLPPTGRASTPQVGAVHPPPAPQVARVHDFEPQLSVSPPVPP